MPLQSVRMLWFSLAQQRDPKGALADADWSLYERRVTDACDPLDGVRDGIVENPARCHFVTRTLLCKPGQTTDCLTAPKLAMLDKIIAPLPDERGRAMDGGLFPGVRTRPGPPSPLLRAMWADAVYDDPKWDALTFRRTADLAAVNRVMPELRADKTAIAPFVAAGHKAIIYQGWQDPSVNAGPTIKYYAALARANGGMAKLEQAVRLFMVPGMYHCRGGPGVDLFGGSAQAPLPSSDSGPDPEHDMLWALIRWVEQGDAPKRVVGRRESAPNVTRTLCAFPASATYDRKGASEDAASFRCTPDPALQHLLSR
jgi:feruloyl esterase